MKVVTAFSNYDQLVQTVSVTAPRPFIDGAYYGAINQAANANANPLPVTPGSEYFVDGGFDWVGTRAGTPNPTVIITPLFGCFGTNQLVQQPAGTGFDAPNIDLVLNDSVTGATGDGYYEVDWTNDLYKNFGIGTLAGVSGLVCVKAKPATNPVVSPQNNSVLKGYGFSVIGGAIAGSKDLRIIGSVGRHVLYTYYAAPQFSSTPTISTPVDDVPGITCAILIYVALDNVPQDNIVQNLAWFYRTLKTVRKINGRLMQRLTFRSRLRLLKLSRMSLAS